MGAANAGAAVSAAAPLQLERVKGGVTFRAFLIGIVLSAVMAYANNQFATVHNAHMLGGIQMPFGSVFVLLLLVLPLNLLLRSLPLVKPFTAIELMTMYIMLLFAAMVSTPGTDNQFMTIGPGLFYFATPENGWANLFYQHVPSWFAPGLPAGWDARTVPKDVINPVFLGGKSFAEIPWQAWMAMLTGWGIFLLLTYSVLFFLSLMFRKQWIEREALAFPLVQLPLQMVDADPGQRPPSAAFWGNRMMWLGLLLAFAYHFLKGMNAHYPDWPVIVSTLPLPFSEKPWNAIPPGGAGINAEVFLGAIGLAFLLTREVSFSFWFFFLAVMFQYVLAEMFGIPVVGLTKAGLMSRPAFMIYQSVGGWVMMAAMLVWTARSYLGRLFREAFTTNKTDEDEPFSSRFMVFGFIFSFGALLGWSSFAGINLFYAFIFFLIFLMTSLVLTRMVIEGGFLFPQAPYFPLEWMTAGMFGTAALGAGTITKLSFLQPTILLDTRTNVLPGFLHVMKIAEVLRLDSQGLRRMLLCAAAAIVVTLVVTFISTLQALYSMGGLQGYTWFTKDASQMVLNNAANLIKTQPTLDKWNIAWMGVGAGLVWLMMMARSRFLWFPLHPLGYIIASGYPITRLWFSMFTGWLIKSLIMKYGGSDTYTNVRPFMIGLILGNLAAEVGWMIIGFRSGTIIQYWPA